MMHIYIYIEVNFKLCVYTYLYVDHSKVKGPTQLKLKKVTHKKHAHK